MKLGKAVVKARVVILILAVLLLIPSVLGMIFTRVNYDMLNYLPDSLDTVKGQKYMLEDFDKGAFSFLIFEDMDDKDIAKVVKDIKKVDHVASVLSYDEIAGGAIPKEMLPDEIYKAFNSGDDTLVAVFFDTSSSADETMDAISKIRDIAGKQCLVSGISAMVTDLRDLCEREEAIYVAIAVLLATVAMMLFLDNWIIPFVFLASIGISILLNLGSNFFLGEISYITKALSAVLQLAVTMDYSIFLWHSYGEHKQKHEDHKEAMAYAIKDTFASVIGSSVTTVAGFIALCFMTFTLGRDLGIVMAKGVVLGVIGCVTVLPAMILALDKVLNISVPSSELIERAVGRRICKACGATYHLKFNPTKVEGKCDECGGELYQRADDTAETMGNRLKKYEESTKPLIDYYTAAGVYAEVDGRQDISKVTESLVAVLKG